ncbi:efflux RND transporter periplasmic adaptor subunit [Romboutsia sp.]|uniref:efflux RND transporter periplasmic adaptor subunit n=1 Tax=Romboutsia sp. TaxID=1965302 RepID=UPI003F38E55A
MIKNRNIILSIVVITIGFSALYFVRKSDDKATVDSNNVPTVQVEKLEQKSIEKNTKFSGTVTGIQEEQLSPKIPTNLKSVNVKKGDSVKKGQVLMVFDSSNVDEQVTQAKNAYDKATAGVEQSKNQLLQVKNQLSQLNTQIENAKKKLTPLKNELTDVNKELDKLKQDKENNLISQAEFQIKSTPLLEKINNLSKEISNLSSSMTTLEVQKVALEKSLSSFDESGINSQISQLKEIYDSTLETKESFTLKAPFDGIVSNINAKVGEVPVGLNPPIVVSDTSQLSLEITVSNKDIGLISIGNEHKVSIQSKKGKIIETSGKIASIEAITGSEEKDYSVKITIPNKEKLESGSFAEIYIPSTKREDTIVISKNALFRTNGTPYVYIVSPENKVKKVKVALGMENDDFVEILSGLRSGHKVITRGKDFVNVGDVVNIAGGDK